MFLTVIVGPMFSGKSSFLVNQYNEEDTIAFKPLIDTRYSNDEIVTHNKNKIKAITTNELLKVLKCSVKSLNDYKKILIDEGQFFNDLENVIEYLSDNYDGKVYVSGLNGDFKRKPLGKINNILSRADNIIFLKGTCKLCPNDSCFSWKNEKGNSSCQVEIGGDEKYIPVCGRCYQKLLKSSSSHNISL